MTSTATGHNPSPGDTANPHRRDCTGTLCPVCRCCQHCAADDAGHCIGCPGCTDPACGCPPPLPEP